MIVDQADFADAVLNPDLTVPSGLLDPHGRPAGKRFDVYRNNVVVSLIDAMQTAFPVVYKLLGESFFKAMAGIYVRAHPPKSPLLMFYGEDFPAFLESFKPVGHLPYLADVARLELLRRHSYHSADVAPISPEELVALSPDDLMIAKLTLVPSTYILASDYPILSIWNMNMAEDAPKPETAGQIVLVTRPHLDVEMTVLDAPTHAFLSDLGGNPLGAAYDAGIQISKDFDLSQAISLLLSQNLVAKIKAKEVIIT